MRRKHWILSKLDGSILNIGCGNLKIDGVNLDHDINVEPDVLSDFHNLPFRDKVFDYVVAFDVLEHTCIPEKLIREVERVSRKGYVVEVLDFDKCRENWVEDFTHKYYINQDVFKKLFPNHQIFEISRMLFALKGLRIRFPYLNYLLWKFFASFS